jgi:hypothetical protein
VTKVAYEPRSGYEDLSGSVSLPDGSSFDVGEALKSGGGRIALDPDQKDGSKAAHDRALVEALLGLSRDVKHDRRPTEQEG